MDIRVIPIELFLINPPAVNIFVHVFFGQMPSFLWDAKEWNSWGISMCSLFPTPGGTEVHSLHCEASNVFLKRDGDREELNKEKRKELLT